MHPIELGICFFLVTVVLELLLFRLELTMGILLLLLIDLLLSDFVKEDLIDQQPNSLGLVLIGHALLGNSHTSGLGLQLAD